MNTAPFKKINWIQLALVILFFVITLGLIQPENGMDMNETRNTIALLIFASQVFNWATARHVILELEKLDLGKQLNQVFDTAKVLVNAMGSTESPNQGAVATRFPSTSPAADFPWSMPRSQSVTITAPATSNVAVTPLLEEDPDAAG